MFDAHSHIGEETGEALVCSSEIGEYPALERFRYRAYGLLWPERDESRRIMEQLEADRRALCGEIGLDRRIRKDMDHVFLESMLGYLHEEKRPFVLHMVGRTDETLSLLTRYSPLPPFIVHGFTGSYETASVLESLGGTISIGPRSLGAKSIGRLLELPFVIETDMKTSPEQRKMLSDVYTKVSEMMGIDIGELERRTEENLSPFLLGD